MASIFRPVRTQENKLTNQLKKKKDQRHFQTNSRKNYTAMHLGEEDHGWKQREKNPVLRIHLT